MTRDTDARGGYFGGLRVKTSNKTSIGRHKLLHDTICKPFQAQGTNNAEGGESKAWSEAVKYKCASVKGGTTVEKYVLEDDELKKSVISKVSELIDCVQKLGKSDLFQITVKHVNGELITKTVFLDKKH